MPGMRGGNLCGLSSRSGGPLILVLYIHATSVINVGINLLCSRCHGSSVLLKSRSISCAPSSRTPAFPAPDGSRIILGSGGRKCRTFRFPPDSGWASADLVRDPPQPGGQCRSRAGFVLFEINGKAATALRERLYLFEGTSFRRVSLLASGVCSLAIHPSVSSRIWGCRNRFLGRLKIRRALFWRESPAYTLRNRPVNHGCSRRNLLDNLYLQIASM